MSQAGDKKGKEGNKQKGKKGRKTKQKTETRKEGK